MTVTDDALATLADALPQGCLVTDPDILVSYRQDWARDPDAVLPLAVARPTTTEEVRW